MRRTVELVVSLLACQFAALGQAADGDEAPPLPLVPWPQELRVAEGHLALSPATRIVVNDDALRAHAGVLADELHRAAGLRPVVSAEPARAGDIELRLAMDDDPREGYTLAVTDRATIAGNHPAAVAQGTATLLQALSRANDVVLLPRIDVVDRPPLPYRGAMLDVARKPYTLDELRQCIQVCRFYKIRYLHLHLTDENAWTFPSRAYPQLGSQNFAWSGGDAPTVFPRDELIELVAWSEARGVTLVPEIELPGHSGQLRGTLPDVFGHRDAAGEPLSLGVLNMANEGAYRTLDTIVGEVCEVFAPSPFIHLGCDEVFLGGIEDVPEVQAKVAELELPYPHAILNYFVHRMHAAVTSRGKRLIVWEGAPVGPNPLPKDVIFMPWVGHSAAAADLVQAGYTVINAPWGVDQPYFDVFRVNRAQLAPGEPLLMGATSILWQSEAAQAVPFLRFTGALRNEPAYNPQARRGLDDFLLRLSRTDPLLDRLLYGLSFDMAGAIDVRAHKTLDVLFDKSLTLRLPADVDPASVRYTLDGSEPGLDSPAWSGEVRLDQSATIKARRVDAAGPAGAVWVRQAMRLPRLPHAAIDAAVSIRPDRPGYSGPGAGGLVDGRLAAANDHAAPGWVGWENDGQPVSILLDRGSERPLRTVAVHCLRGSGGVALPQSVEVALSADGESFRPAGQAGIAAATALRGWYVVSLEDAAARYVQVRATHSGDWTFVDEVAIDPQLPGPDVDHRARGRSVALAIQPSTYTAPGVAGLTDGYTSNAPNFLSLEWLGFDGQPLDATIDLGEATPVGRVRGRFLQYVGAGIFIPAGLEVHLSMDGQTFHKAGELAHAADSRPLFADELTVAFPVETARYIRVLARPAGQWLFVDELLVDGD